jgi:hypothetical protein
MGVLSWIGSFRSTFQTEAFRTGEFRAGSFENRQIVATAASPALRGARVAVTHLPGCAKQRIRYGKAAMSRPRHAREIAGP